MADNPIRKVNGTAIAAVPSSYVWKLEDVSSHDAGRTEDTKMHKKRIGQVKGIELRWNYLSISVASSILKAFNPEYVTVEYLDAKEGGYVTAEFYVGNRSAPMYNAALGLWENISFNLIKRRG